MITWTAWTKRLQKKIDSYRRISIWRIIYIPKFRYISLSGDGLLSFRGTIAVDGKSILITAVNSPVGFDKRVKIDGRALCAHRQLTPEQFEDAVLQKLHIYS